MVTLQETLGYFQQEYGKLPSHKEVCPRCGGNGTHVNPAIDGHGISTSDEIWQDDDFREGYFSGRYDVVCDECKGANVIDVIDEDAIPPHIRPHYDEWIASHYETEAIYAAERRMGA